MNFSAVVHAGSTSKLLSDYEEGTWTPAINFSTSNGNLSYTTQVGRYTKVGRCVTFQLALIFGETTASGYISSISGFPFTSMTSIISGSGAYIDNMTGLAGGAIWSISASSSSLNIYMSGTGTAQTITNTNTGAASNVIVISGFYYTA